MNIIFGNGFEKILNKLPQKIKNALEKRLDLFAKDSQARILNIHKLKGILKNYRSINITGDYRLIFEECSNNTIKLIDIGTHSELYE